MTSFSTLTEGQTCESQPRQILVKECKADRSINYTCCVYNKASYLPQGMTVADTEKSKNTPAGYRHSATSQISTDTRIISDEESMFSFRGTGER